MYAKRPSGGAEQVFRYPPLFAPRNNFEPPAAVAGKDQGDAFLKDWADDHQIKEMRRRARNFCGDFAARATEGRKRIRHYGLLASVNVASKLEQCRRLLKQEAKPRRSCKAAERVLE